MKAKKPRGRPRRADKVEIRVGATVDDEKPTEPESPDEAALEESQQQFPQGTVAKLYKVQEDGNVAFVAQTSPEAMTEERISRAGPGKYRVQFWGPLNDGTGRKGYRGHRTVVIADGVRAVTGPVSNPDGSDASATLQAAMTAQVIGMMEAMGKQRSIELQLLERIVQRPERDWAPIVAAVAPVAGQIMSTLLQRKDPVELAAEIQKIAGRNDGQRDGLTQFREFLSITRDLFKEPLGKPPTDPDEPWWAQAAERIVTGVMMAQRGAEPGPEPEPQPPQQPAPALPPSGAALMPRSLFTSLAPRLLAWATEGRNPAWVAEALLYDVPPGLHPSIGAQLRDNANAVNGLIASDERFTPHREWLDSLRAELVALIFDDDEGGETEAPPGPEPETSGDDAPKRRTTRQR